ncbi:MAG: class beta-lactamase-related serine hydrolase [Deltaproteobacteria bacterium]|nr:class beta-lactamase-related serine hydrolase [Deltaproteobacteria bacterium]
MQLSGVVDPRFQRVREAFTENFASRGELGAAVAVIVDGRTVVDLWGGVVDRGTRQPWTSATLALIFSCTKAATALCAHILAARRRLDLDAPVAAYWPEFAAAGKERLPVRMLLNHQAGLPAVDEVLPADALFDWTRVTAALAAQAPHWHPGSAHGYHAMTFGWLVGEVVRRVSGQSVGAFFREHVAGPLGLDFWIGLPAAFEPRVATLRMPPLQPKPSPLLLAMRDRTSLVAKAFLNPPGLTTPGRMNSRAVHAAELPAANGMATARGLAGLYAPLACGGRWKGVELVDTEALRAMSTVESDGPDSILLLPTRFSAGFMKTIDNRPADSVIMGPNPAAFGHGGAGGSIGMADPVARVAIGYVMNQLGPGVFVNPRGQALIDAVYESLN